MSYEKLAQDHHVSVEAVTVLAQAIALGRGTQAQFNHPELGGMGQWQPGMIMIGDAFNQPLKAKVTSLCEQLAARYASGERASFATMPTDLANWWPDHYGAAAVSGSQNDMAYAYFRQHKRLLIRRGDAITTYDTTGYVIQSVSQQQQNNARSLTFMTDRGLMREDDFTPVTP